MKPFLFYHENFSIPSFAFMLMMASLVATGFAYLMAPRNKLSQIIILDLGILGTIAAIIGGRLFHVFVEEFGYYLQHPSHIYQIWRGGFVSYGAFIGLGVALTSYLKFRKAPILPYLDHLAVYACPFVDFFVRLGCLLAGCCYGTPTDSFLSIIFHSGDAGSKYPGVPLHPTQLYSMAAALMNFGFLLWLKKRQTFRGQLITSFLLFYAVSRFLIEFLRGDPERGVYFDNVISTAQIMSIITCIAAGFDYLKLKKKFPLV